MTKALIISTSILLTSCETGTQLSNQTEVVETQALETPNHQLQREIDSLKEIVSQKGDSGYVVRPPKVFTPENSAAVAQELDAILGVKKYVFGEIIVQLKNSRIIPKQRNPDRKYIGDGNYIGDEFLPEKELVSYDTKTYYSEVEEFKSFSQDEEYKFLDNLERSIRQKHTSPVYGSNLDKVTSRKVFSYNSYAEASRILSSKRN